MVNSGLKGLISRQLLFSENRHSQLHSSRQKPSFCIYSCQSADILVSNILSPLKQQVRGRPLKGLAQAKIIKKSVILFRVLNMTI